MAEEIVELRETAEERYLNYALSVITSRALPDVRDGLKPVQRRILFAMFRDLRLASGAKARKSAAVVGEVLGKYHPHGDVAAYEAMVRMAQPFALRYPLVHGEGNFGSLDGDGAAAMRYTEARLTPIAESLLEDLPNDTVSFRSNYDGTREEPVVLPATVPVLLANGSTGIAVGMATNIPPHNLGELVDALTLLIQKPKTTDAKLLEVVRGPDFPTGGEILNDAASLREIYSTGQGAIRIRGEFTVEKLPRGKDQVIVTSVPYGVNKGALIDAIAQEILSRGVPQIVDVRDESTDDVRIVLELKPGADPKVAMAYLYKHTELATNFHVNLTALVPTGEALVGQPRRLSLRELCRHFLDFRFEVVERRLGHEKARLEDRLHILDALAKIHVSLDEAIKLIRSAESRADASAKLRKKFRLDERQADAILEIRLYQLAKLEIAKIEEERKEKKSRLSEVKDLLGKPRRRWTLVKTELENVKKRFADPRRTAIGASTEIEYDAEAYVVDEPATVVVTRDGWVKRVRELKDRSTTRLREGDEILRVLDGNTRDSLAVFSTHGGLYVMGVRDVPATTGYGEPLASLLKLSDRESALDVALVPAAPERPSATPSRQAELFAEAGGDAEWLVVTAKGFGFRFVPDFSPTSRTGRKFARLSAGDRLVGVQPVAGDQIVLVARRGKMLRLAADDVPVLSGPGKGVYLLRPGDPPDAIVGARTGGEKSRFDVAIAGGASRRIRFADVPPGRRGGKGLKVVKRGEIAAIGTGEE